MRRMSIWPILVELIICLTVLCGCHAEGSVSTPSPDSSRSPYLSELYLLKYDPAFTICDVTVNRVFDYIYDGGYQGDEFLVVDCTVEHIFFRAPSTCGNDEWVEPNSTVFLWIDIAGLDESVIESLRSLSEDVDSMIVYGREIVPTVFKDSPECMMFVEEVGENNIGYTQNIEGEDVLDIPSSIEIFELSTWQLLPIIDGQFDAEPIVEIVSRTDDEVMAFDMNLLPPAGHRYFKNGDSKETVYSALEQYVNEVKEEKNHDQGNCVRQSKGRCR